MGLTSKTKDRKKEELLLQRQNESSQKIQGMFLRWRSRKDIRKAASSMYEQRIDPDTGAFYYVNLRTGQTKWEKPYWFDPPIAKNREAGADLRELDEQLKLFREEEAEKGDTIWPLVFPSGELYEGMVQYGSTTPEGAGCMITPNGGRYCGEWHNGKRHGWGTQNYPDGSTYEGEWFNDQVHGFAVKIELDGSDYAGMFRLGTRSGLGVSRSSLGLIYEGQFSDDMQHGFGVEWHMEPDHFHGIAYRAGMWERGLFCNTTPRFCCDIPKGHQTKESIDEAKTRAIQVARQAREQLPTTYVSRKRANQARQRAENERQRTRLTNDMVKLGKLKNSQSTNATNPYIVFLEEELDHSLRRQGAAERRLANMENMANLAEQQWTAAQSFHDQLKKERDDVAENLVEATKWEDFAKDRWATIAEMRETLLQLRIALHIGKNQHRLMDRRGRAAMKNAEELQKKINSLLANVNRSQSRKSHNIIGQYHSETDDLYGAYTPVGSLPYTPLGTSTMTGPRTPGSPLRQSRYSVSRGAITTAGSSVAGLSVPVTTPNSPLYNLSAVPVYYTDAATQQRASITNLPLTPILSSPNTKKSTARNPSTLPDVARRPFSSDADEALAGQYLSDFTAKAYGKKFTNKKSFF